jgi:hypothetical protein
MYLSHTYTCVSSAGRDTNTTCDKTDVLFCHSGFSTWLNVSYKVFRHFATVKQYLHYNVFQLQSIA